jgi:plasmid stabilization system protein ParE
MSSFVLTPLAKADVFEIWCYIAQDSEAAADRVESAVFEACAFVTESPQSGHLRPEFTGRALRFWTLTKYPNYTIVYRPETTPLQIVAVLHGMRNLRRILKSRS